MIYRMLADAVALIHLAFVLFVLLGGLLALRWRRTMWLHLPAAVWGILVELAGWICPLTPLESWLRLRGGEQAFTGGFVERHILPVLYPDSLSRGTQIALGAIALAVNAGIYTGVILRGRRAGA